MLSVVNNSDVTKRGMVRGYGKKNSFFITNTQRARSFIFYRFFSVISVSLWLICISSYRTAITSSLRSVMSSIE